MMTGLFALFCEVAWSEIHWLPQTPLLGLELWPQLSGYSCKTRHYCYPHGRNDEAYVESAEVDGADVQVDVEVNALTSPRA